MTIAEMFGQSAVLALLGMGIVFGFLVILILSVDLVAKFIKLTGWDSASQEASPASAQASSAPKDAAVMAAISVAVDQYRKTN